jgi:hypothetical protein
LRSLQYCIFSSSTSEDRNSMNQWHEMKIEVQSQNKKTKFKKI